jgi:hypothetical protein
MSAELELGMRVDALIVTFLEEEGTNDQPVRLVVPACEVCGDSAGEVTWYHAKTGRARCVRCLCHEAREARRRGAPAPEVDIQAQGHAGTAEAVQAKKRKGKS